MPPADSVDDTDGRVYRRRLGSLLTGRGRGADPDRELEAIVVFLAEHSPIGQAACQRQVAAWESQAKVAAVARPLRGLRAEIRNGVEPVRGP